MFIIYNDYPILFYKIGDIYMGSMINFIPSYEKPCALILKNDKYLTPIKQYGEYLNVANTKVKENKV